VKIKCALVLSLALCALFYGKAMAQEWGEATGSSDGSSISIKTSPLGQRATARELFGSERGYIHPFVSVGGYYTDNLYNVDEDEVASPREESEWVGTITPGIWLAFPASRQQLLQMSTQNISPGGLEISRFKTDAERRSQAYALYSAEFNFHKNFPGEDVVNHRAEGMLLHNFRGGLTVELADVFEINHDEYATNVGSQRDEFKSNIVSLLGNYQISSKLRVRADFSLFSLNYDNAARNGFRDRDDTAVSGYVFFKVRPKTSLFLEYEFVDVVYDQDFSPDSVEHHYFGGVQWDVSAKSRGRFKAGYGQKDFDDPTIKDSDDFLLEFQFDHRFSPKTSGYIQAYRKTNETDVGEYKEIFTDSLQLGYAQKIRTKLNGAVNLYYVRDSYRGRGQTNGIQIDDRKDDYYSAGFSLGYDLQEWLALSLGYTFTLRDSNFNIFDYKDNTTFLSLTTAL